jgi:hypothetical protein
VDLSFLVDQRNDSIEKALTLARMVQCCNMPNPVYALLGIFGPSRPDPNVAFIAGTNLQPNVIVCQDGLQLLVLLGGATVASQATNYVAGIESGLDVRDNTDTVSSIYGAARIVANQLFGYGGFAGRNVYIVGHSYGGAIGLSLGSYLGFTGTPNSISMTTFGSPRPGGPLLAGRLSRMSVFRYMNDGDIVPWLAPHADEVPTMLLVSPVSLWRGANNLCQPPSGRILRNNGTCVSGMGSPPPNWGFTLSLYQYVTNVMVGGAGPFHSIAEYVARVQAVVSQNPTPPAPVPQVAEVPLVQRPREREATIRIGEAEIFADATSPTGSTRNYQPQPVQDPAAPRYRASRDQGAWVIRLGTQVVGAATGKRNAKKVARAWNKAARATL